MTTEEQKFEIMRHELVPQHIIMGEEEAQKLLKTFNIQTDQLPKILDTDPAVIAIGASPGQIIKIVRKSRTSKHAISYRLVVESSK